MSVCVLLVGGLQWTGCQGSCCCHLPGIFSLENELSSGLGANISSEGNGKVPATPPYHRQPGASFGLGGPSLEKGKDFRDWEQSGAETLHPSPSQPTLPFQCSLPWHASAPRQAVRDRHPHLTPCSPQLPLLEAPGQLPPAPPGQSCEVPMTTDDSSRGCWPQGHG